MSEQLCPEVKDELRLWRLQAQVFTPCAGAVQDAIVVLLERQLPNAFPTAADLTVVEVLPTRTRPFPAPFDGAGTCVEVTLLRQCNQLELNEIFDAFLQRISPVLQAFSPEVCVLFSCVMSMSTSSALGCDAMIGWHLPDPLAHADLGSALMETVGWRAARTQDLTGNGHILMFSEFAPAGAAPPTPAALAHAKTLAFADESWPELIGAVAAWERSTRLEALLPTASPPPGPFSRM